MTVSSSDTSITHNCDGISVNFPVSYYFLADTNLVVTLVVDGSGSDGVVLTLGTDYSVAGAGNEAGGSITTSIAYPAGRSLVIDRVVPVTQVTQYQPNDAFPAKVTERALDKLTMICQQLWNSLGGGSWSLSRVLMLGPRDVNGSGAYRANGNKISNLADGQDLHDAVTVGQIAPFAEAAEAAAQAAAASAASAAGSLADFEKRYLGPFDSDPTQDNAGNPLTEGALYWNTANQVLKVFDGVAWNPFTDSAALVYQRTDAGSKMRSLQDRLMDIVFLADFDGYDPTGVTPSDAAFLSAIAALPHGGAIEIDVAASLLLTTPLVAHQPVLLRSSVCGDVAAGTNGSANGKPMIRWGGAADEYMFTIEPATTGNIIFGGGAVGIEWDGATLATAAVHLNNTNRARFDGKVRNVRFAGVFVSALAGSTGNFSMQNRIDLDFVWGASPVCQEAHGVAIVGNGSNIPTTQQQLGLITGLVYNGHLVHITESDNCMVSFVNGAVQAPGTGVAMYLGDNGSQPSNHTLILHLAGKFFQEPTVKGTRLVHYVSEGGGIASSGSSNWNGDIFDYATARSFASHQYKLRDWINIRSADFVPGPNTSIVESASQWACLALPNSGSPRGGCTMPPDYDLANGLIETIELYYTTSGSAGGNLALAFTLSTPPVDDSARLVTPEHNVTKIVAQAPQNTVKRFSYTLDTPVTYTLGDIITFAVQRLASDAGDTATDEVIILGARLGYKSNGPDSSGSGTYFIPAWD